MMPSGSGALVAIWGGVALLANARERMTRSLSSRKACRSAA